jgi:hypothetical protein
VTRHAVTAAQIEVPDPPTRRDLSPIKLGFRVRQIEDLRPVFESLGGRLDAGTAAWEFYGFARLDGVDPEGNVVQLLQPLTRS